MGGGSLSGNGRSARDTTGALSELKNLYDMGAITPEEYEEKRKKLLKDL
ncbi:MAG: SHOCT domain-containing protein [Planktothrix sp.]